MEPYNLTDAEAQEYLRQEGVTELLEQGQTDEISPEWDDLARLHILARKRRPFQVLEFGSGFSTIVLAAALKQNWEDYLGSRTARQPDSQWKQPSMVSIESSEQWRDNTAKKVGKLGLLDFAEIVFSEVKIAEYQGQICHFYDRLPNIVPDFVYLDGPDPSTVMGDINGLSFLNPQRTVMSGDVLKYESTLLPGFFMIVDARTNNARFLQRMLKRNFTVQYHQVGDVTTFELNEPRLGRKNIYGWEVYSENPLA